MQRYISSVPFSIRPYYALTGTTGLLLFFSMMLSPLIAGVPADSTASAAGIGIYEVDSAEVFFHSGTQIQSFSGETNQAEGHLNTETGIYEFRVDMASVTTGNNRRDRHMREDYMETNSYPYVEYEGELSSIPEPEQATSGQQVRSTGRFTIKDQTRDVEIDGSLRYDSETNRWHVQARFSVLLSDYEISRPSWLFLRMQDEQEIELSFVLIPSS